MKTSAKFYFTRFHLTFALSHSALVDAFLALSPIYNSSNCTLPNLRCSQTLCSEELRNLQPRNNLEVLFGTDQKASYSKS